MRTDADAGRIDIDALRKKYLHERDKRLRPEGSKQYLELKDDFAEFAEVDPYTPVMPRAPIDENIDVAVLGGGITGLLAGAYLKKAGVEDVHIIEMGGDFGGVWYWNRFPGIQCDNDAYCYIPMLEELGYIPSKKFADGDEIYEHCHRIGKHFGLYDGAILSTQVAPLAGMRRSSAGGWAPTAATTFAPGSSSCAQGSFNRPKLPGIPGIKEFKGHMFHSARWDYDYTGGDSAADCTSCMTSAWRWWVPVRPACSWFRTWAETHSTSTSFSARPHRWTCGQTSRRTRSGRHPCSPAGRRNASATFTAGHRWGKVWCSTSQIWSAISGPSSGAT